MEVLSDLLFDLPSDLESLGGDESALMLVETVSPVCESVDECCVDDDVDLDEVGVVAGSVIVNVDMPSSITSAPVLPDNGAGEYPSIARCAFAWSSSILSTYFSGMRCNVSSSTNGGNAAAINTLLGGCFRLMLSDDWDDGSCRSVIFFPKGPFTISRSNQVVYAFTTDSTNNSGPRAGPVMEVSVAVARRWEDEVTLDAEEDS